MSDLAIDDNPRSSVDLLGSSMAYVDVEPEDGGKGTVVLLHGNPTSSYLWRNVIKVLQDDWRCVAPDLIGMGASGPHPEASYTFADHAEYLDAWFDAVLPDEDVRLVIHDWGGALGFHWAKRNPDRVKAIVYMETIVTPLTWDDWPEAARGIFQGFRSPKGEDMILQRNMFIEGVLPASVLRKMSDAEMDTYRAPWMEPGEDRRPMLTWPRQIPIEGEPADVTAIVEASAAWAKSAPVPKLFVNADPGSILVGRPREVCRGWANQEEITVKGLHFIQEDSGAEIGAAANAFFKKNG
jgi:haloalkane dehalogenase